jgi:hypothetical protein
MCMYAISTMVPRRKRGNRFRPVSTIAKSATTAVSPTTVVPTSSPREDRSCSSIVCVALTLSDTSRTLPGGRWREPEAWLLQCRRYARSYHHGTTRRRESETIASLLCPYRVYRVGPTLLALLVGCAASLGEEPAPDTQTVTAPVAPPLHAAPAAPTLPPAISPEPIPETSMPPAPKLECPSECPDLGSWPFRPGQGDVYLSLSFATTFLTPSREPVRDVVTIFRDQHVEYRSDGAAWRPCSTEEQLSPELARKLDAILRGANLTHLADAYDRYDRSDGPISVVTYTPTRGTTKTIRHYWGDTSPDAEKLGDMELEVGELIGLSRWREPDLKVKGYDPLRCQLLHDK